MAELDIHTKGGIMTRVELIKLLQIKREESIAQAKRQREKGNEYEAQFLLGRQSAFLTAENLVRRYMREEERHGLP